MKNKFLFALLIALCALLLTACSIDLPIPGIPTPGDGPTPGSDQTPMTLENTGAWIFGGDGRLRTPYRHG